MKLTGKISGGGSLKGKTASDRAGHVRVKTEKSRIKPEEYYDGEYIVTPKVEEQKLETKNKYMTDDVTVEKIPCAVVSNTAGGNTVYIAKEI